MNKKLGILLSIGTAALLVTGCGSSSDVADEIKDKVATEQPATGGNNVDTGETGGNNVDTGETGGETQKMTAFTTDWLNGKTLYLVAFDDFGSENKKWNMGSMTFDETTMTWREFDTAGAADDESFISDYAINDDGSVNLIDFEDTIKLTPQQTADYLVVCQMDKCNTRLYYDKQKAKAYRDSKNSQDIPLTVAMLDGKTFYNKDANANDSGYGYLKLTFSATEVTIHEIREGNDQTFSVSYTVEDGKLKTDDEYLSLEDQDAYAWYLSKSNGGTDVWYFSKPADFPEEL